MYRRSMFRAKIRKISVFFFHLKIIVLTAVKKCSILHRRVFVTITQKCVSHTKVCFAFQYDESVRMASTDGHH